MKPSKTIQPYKYSALLAAAAICILGFLVYSQILHSEFQFDDWKELQEGYALRQFPNLGAIWNFSAARFLTYLTFGLNYYFHGLSVEGYHLTSLFFHLLTAVFVFLFSGQILKTPQLQQLMTGKPQFAIALTAGLIFAVHPIQTQAVTYIIQRASVLAALGYTAALYFYLRWRLGGEVKNYFFALLATLAAMFSKQNAFTLPLAVLTCEVLFFKGWAGVRENISRILPFLASLAILPLLLLKYRLNAKTTNIGEGAGISSFDYLVTQFNVLVTYLRLLFFPAGQNLDYDYPVSHSILDHGAGFSLLLLLGLIIFAFFVLKKHRLISFCIFWFFLTLSVESSFLPIKDVIFEHRLYLPMAGFSIFTAYFLSLFFRDVKKFSIVSALIILALSIAAYQRNEVWKDGIRLWQDTAKKSPHKARPFHNLSFLYSARGDFKKAIEYGEMAVARNPDSSGPYLTLGVAYGRMGNFDKEIEFYQKSFERGSWQPAKYFNNLGSAYGKKGDLAKAVENFEKAIQAEPAYPPSYGNLGFAYDQMGQFDRALSYYKKAIELDPHFSEAYNYTAIAYAKKGEFSKAFPFAEKSVKLNPNYADGYNTLALIYGQKGDLNKMITYLERAVKVDPHYLKAHENLANANAQKRKPDAGSQMSDSLPPASDL